MSIEPILDELEIRTDPFALCELRGTCDLGLGRDSQATLHYVLAGEGAISIPGHPALPIRRGSLVLIPALQNHVLRSFGQTVEPVPTCRPAELNLANLMQQADCADGCQLVALCAHVRVGLRGVTDMIELVRDPLVEQVADDPTLRPALQSLLRELAAPSLGSRAMIRALLLQCMIEMLRRQLASHDSKLHWMAALTDPLIWGALRRMLDAPGDMHSVETLAQQVGMSRSSFAKRFTDAYGSGPMELLRDLRMRQAGTLLSNTDLPVKRIAERVGFASRSAFTRTFEARTGQSPSVFRAQQKARKS